MRTSFVVSGAKGNQSFLDHRESRLSQSPRGLPGLEEEWGGYSKGFGCHWRVWNRNWPALIHLLKRLHWLHGVIKIVEEHEWKLGTNCLWDQHNSSSGQWWCEIIVDREGIGLDKANRTSQWVKVYNEGNRGTKGGSVLWLGLLG